MWWLCWNARPVQGGVPGLLRERAGQEQVLDGLRLLIAEEASGVVLQAATGQPFCYPAPVLAGQPMEESDSGWRPAFPCQLP